MGQKPSGLGGKAKLPFSWVFRRQETTCNPTPEQPIRFQYKTRRKYGTQEDKNQNRANNIKSFNNVNNIKTINNLSKAHQSNKNVVKNTNVNEVKCRIVKTQNALRTKSEPNLMGERGRERHKHRRKSARIRDDWEEGVEQFGYEIQDVDDFLTKVGGMS
jgi:hypothetical protein